MTNQFDAFDIPFSGIEQQVVDWVKEALELRHGSGGDPQGPINGWGSTEDSPKAVMELLIRVRARSDRVDELLAKATQARGRAKRAQDEAKFQAEVAYNEASVNGRRVDFSSGRERHAEAQLGSLEQQRLAHQTARLVSITAEAHEVITQVYYQLGAMRNDLRATLHALQFESGLER